MFSGTKIYWVIFISCIFIFGIDRVLSITLPIAAAILIVLGVDKLVSKGKED